MLSLFFCIIYNIILDFKVKYLYCNDDKILKYICIFKKLKRILVNVIIKEEKI